MAGSSRIRRSTRIRERARARFRAQRAACYLCGRPIDYAAPYLHPLSFVVDHRVSLARGGADSLANMAPAHRSCNRAKSDRADAPVIRVSATLT